MVCLVVVVVVFVCVFVCLSFLDRLSSQPTNTGTLTDLTITQPSEGAEEVNPNLTLEGGDLQEPFLPGGVGIVRATYASVDDAMNAQKKLSGRKFNGRTVVSSLAPLK